LNCELETADCKLKNMAGNSIGKTLVLTTFGESHGTAAGGVLDGFPSRIPIDPAFILAEINRRNPANYPFSTPRNEEDEPEILSGLFEGVTTGAPIAFIIRNKDQRPEDYAHLKDLYRPSHADFTYEKKYGIRDFRGGGRSSARTTVAWVAGGAFAKIFLAREGITISGFVSQIGPHRITNDLALTDTSAALHSPLACPDANLTAEMLLFLEKIRAEGDTAGGVVTCRISGVPPGLGEPLFDKLQSDLAKAVMSIPAVKGFETGSGFAAAAMTGSQHNDLFIAGDAGITTGTNFSGGIQGGISNGMDIVFRAAFKPVSSIGREQTTVDKAGNATTFQGKGRHDVCVVPRAVPIVEAMAALVIADHFIRTKTNEF
jgi:chorismate synthase